METESVNESGDCDTPRVASIEKALKRYEEEIQTICRSSAQARESYKRRSSPLRQSALRTDRSGEQSDTADARKLQTKIHSLEDYIQTLEARLKDALPPRSGREDVNFEVSCLKTKAISLAADNESLRSEMTSLESSLHASETRLAQLSAEHNTCSAHHRSLEESVSALQTELRVQSQENSQLATSYRQLEQRHAALQDDFGYYQSQAERTFQEKMSALESELWQSRNFAMQKDQENVRLIKKMHDFLRDAEATQCELHHRIHALETQMPSEHDQATPEKRTMVRHSSRMSDGGRDSKERKETVGRASAPRRKNSRSMADGGISVKCENCGKAPRGTHHRSKSPIAG